MGGSCSDNWYTITSYDDLTFTVLQPKKMVCHNYADGDDSSVSYDEFQLMMRIYFHAGSALILFILYRSCSKQHVDAFRLIFIYLFGTWLFGFMFEQTCINHVGFNRLMGYGVMVHNIGEWFLISRIWFGDRSVTAMPALCYLLSFVLLVTMCPLVPLFFIGMLQGATVDFLLVITLITLYRWTQQKAESGAIQSRRKYMCYGLWAAILHLVS